MDENKQQNINKQVVYVKPSPEGWCFTFSYLAKYANQPGWYQAFIDTEHLAGFGDRCFTVRYDFNDHTLHYPKNWPKDQKDTIADLQKQLKAAVTNGDAVKSKLATAIANSQNLSKIVMTLQQQLAAIQGAKKGDNK